MYLKSGVITSIGSLNSSGYVIVKDNTSKTTYRKVYLPSTCKYTLAVDDNIFYLYSESGCAVYVPGTGWGTVTASSLVSKLEEYCVSFPSSLTIQAAIINSTTLYVAEGLSYKEAAALQQEMYTLGCAMVGVRKDYYGLFLCKTDDRGPQSVEDFVTKSYVETNFLSQSDASNTYLASKDASRLYVYKTDLETLYYTAAQVDGLIPTNVSQLTNDSDFVTSTAVANNYLNKTTAAATYATRSDVEATYLKQSDASSTYLTQEAALDNYLLQQDAADKYATKTSIPTKTSQLTNDSDFITSTALSPYLKTADAASTYITKTDAASTYATKTSIPTKVSQLTNDAGFITGTYIASNYYNMVQVDTKVSDVKDAIPTKVSQLENDAGYITDGGGSFRDHVHQLIGDATIANMALSVAQKAVMKSYYTGKVIE